MPPQETTPQATIQDAEQVLVACSAIGCKGTHEMLSVFADRLSQAAQVLNERKRGHLLAAN